MIADLKPYPEYKDSGVEWLGKVPVGWQVRRLKRVARLAYGESLPSESRVETGVIPVHGSNGIVGTHCEANTRAPTLVVGRKGSFGKLSYSEDPVFAIDTTFYVDSTTTSHHMPWIAAVMRTLELDKHSRDAAIPGLDREDAYERVLAVPPRDVQRAIGSFARCVDSRIDRLVDTQERLIALLEEEKQAIIHRAVTRGLDQDVPLKPSRTDWLGDVPAHWEVVKLGKVLEGVDQGWSPVAAEGRVAPDQWSVLTLSAVRAGVFDGGAVKPVPRESEVPSSVELHEGDLLMTRSNTRERVGDVCIATDVQPRTLFSDLIYRLRVNQVALDEHFAMWQLLSAVGRNQIERDARGSSDSMPKIAQRLIRSWFVCVPPREEQEAIARRVDKAASSLSKAIAATQRQINLLEELRTRLISDVVTGKLDVREAAARLPDEDDPDAEVPELDESLETVIES